LFAALAWDLRTSQLGWQIRSIRHKPIGDLDHLDARHGKTRHQAKSRGQHLVREDANVPRIVLNLVT
jgi:hypothetical protein